MLLPRCKKERSRLAVWVRVVFGFLILYGVGSFILNMLLAVYGTYLAIPNSLEFPLGLPDAIAVDGGDRVYCFSMFNGRIQEYDGKGGFVRGWFVPCGGGVAFLRVSGDHELEVLAVRGRTILVYDSAGLLIRTRNGNDEYDDFPTGLSARGSEVDSPIWEIRHPWLYPSIVKMNGMGGEPCLVRNSFLVWPMGSPFAAWLLVLVSGGLLKYLEMRAGKGEEEPRTNANGRE